MLVTAWIINPDTGVEMQVNVLLDTGSSLTLVAQPTADYLELKGEAVTLKLNGVTDARSTIESRVEEFELESMDCKRCCGLIKDARVIPVISNDIRGRYWRPIFKKHGIEGHPPAPTGRVDVLVGWKDPLLLLQLDHRIVSDQFILIKTALGWSACGLAHRRVDKHGTHSTSNPRGSRVA